MPSPSLLQEVVADAAPLLGGGKVADYIPELAKVPSQKLGIAVCTARDGVIGAGDYQEPFSIQSISKVFALVQTMGLYEERELWQRVGKEPSGNPFNSLVQLEFEKGVPRNPFINAGALVITDMLQTRLSAPRQRMLEMVRNLSGNEHIISDRTVAMSEYQHSARNAAIAYLMKSFGNFDNEVEQVLHTYFSHCAIRMSCADLARAFFFLCNKGASLDHRNVLSEKQNRQVNALLATSGLYDGSGEFAYRVGMPGKSGVGGGIIAVIPGEMSVCVWSPELDSSGNSLAGIAMLEQVSKRLGRSIF
ncbi:glutaminase B [Ferrimonas marina]|uniref:Glutaminase n=1 Tax=Ferrimonas marina TaxID=299255 RepID=A0A1M5YDU7_9GAMM|nr:glutaminase B [Ferrimonas marina]SHI10064.1 L-glutaminase [Ferrimonas marina]